MNSQKNKQTNKQKNVRGVNDNRSPFITNKYAKQRMSSAEKVPAKLNLKMECSFYKT